MSKPSCQRLWQGGGKVGWWRGWLGVLGVGACRWWGWRGLGGEDGWCQIRHLTVEATPPMSSSRITGLERQSLLDVFADVPDPRDRRGRRHRLEVILALTAAAVLAGCKTLVAVWEHVCDLGDHVLSELGVEDGQQVPCESTIRRALARVDADDFDTRVASWLTLRHGQIAGRRVIAVDGKTMRGSRTREPGVHLLAALDQASRAVIAQQRVAAKTNEIPALPTLLADHDLDGVLVTADALHTNRHCHVAS